MKPTSFRLARSLLAYSLTLPALVGTAASTPTNPGHDTVRGKPNIIHLVSDELGYYEPGFMGGQTIKTPNFDRLAAEGVRFNNMFGGGCVCAPTRCCLLTGKHAGHTSIRVNGGGTPLRAEEVTTASMLKPLGYATGGFGKWGLGGRDSTGVPEKHGFDVFFGYYDQVHAHSYYPPYLIRNSEEVVLPGNQGGVSGKTYSQYVIHAAALQFIREHAKQPFFLYLPYTPPHGLFDIPDPDPAWAIYKDQPWKEDARRYAAMVTMEDRQLGEVMSLLKELGLEQNTLIMLSGDNGGADYFVSDQYPRGVHSANKNPKTGVEFRGKKGMVYEGGLRVPFAARWPGKIPPGTVTDLLAYFPDVLPTIAEITGAQAPADIDGLSLLPTLVGEAAAGHAQKQHEYLYWEHSHAIAIRQGNWRAVQPKANAPWELYDLTSDPSEAKNLAQAKPEIVAKLTALADKAHAPAVEGTFSRTDRHERDRRAKFGKQDAADEPGPAAAKKKATAKPAATAAMPTKGILANKDWKIIRVSSENTANQKFARNAIDGDPATLWHSRFTGTPASPPHELVIDLGAEHVVRGLVYLGRQDAGWNGAVKDVEFCVSQSPTQFDQPLVKTQLAKTKEPQTIPCPATKGRYILFRALSEHSNHQFATVAELGILGD